MILDANKILESLINLNPEPIKEPPAPKISTNESDFEKVLPALIYVPFITPNMPLTKFHFMKCEILRNMTEARLKRCRLSCRTDGMFTMSDNKQHKLEVCGYCVKEFEELIKPKSIKQFYWGKNFSITKLFTYLEESGKRFIDAELWAKIKMGVILSNDYPSHWGNISFVCRASQHYKCERCGADLDGGRYLLHVHHINGVKSDVNPDNLINLCAMCHNLIHQREITALSHEDIIYILTHTIKAIADEGKIKKLAK